MEKHLTEQCLTIILLKKQMNAQDWPCLQKAEAVLPLIEMDFKQWTEEHEETQSDGVISAKTDRHSPGMNNEEQVMIFNQD